MNTDSAPVPDKAESTPGFFEDQIGRAVPPRESVFLIISVAVADFLMYSNFGGSGFALTVLYYTAGVWLLHEDRRTDPNVLLVLALLFVLMGRNIWSMTPLSVAVPVILLGALSVCQRTDERKLLDSLIFSATSYFAGPARLREYLAPLHRALFYSTNNSWLRLVIPALGSLAALIIFTAIFLMANPIVDRLINDGLNHFRKYIDLWSLISIWRFMFWFLVAMITAGLLKPYIKESIKLTDHEDQLSANEDNPDVSAQVLTLTGILIVAAISFTAYNALDIYYLWISAELPEGITYSQYARQGTGWLTLALLVSSAVIGVASSECFSTQSSIARIKKLSYYWVLQDTILALAVLKRIQMYVEYNGLTPLRITGIFGVMTVIAGILVLAVKLRGRKNLIWLIRRYAAVFIVGLTVYAAFPSAWFSARFNANQAMNGNVAPLVWIFEKHEGIPIEGVSQLVTLLDHPDPVISEGISAYLARYSSKVDEEKTRDWRRFQLARAQSVNALKTLGNLPMNELAYKSLKMKVAPYR